MDQLLDLSVIFTLPPPNSSPDAIASIVLYCEALGFKHTGDLLTDPLTQREREDLNWYLEEYWKWPYEGFLERGKTIERLLPQLGKRLYKAVFGSASAAAIVQTWQSHLEVQHQISIVSNMVSILSLPWELLHDGKNFLSMQTNLPVSIVRRLPQSTLAENSITFEPPLRVLLIISRPTDESFVDPRSIAHELLDIVQKSQEESGTIELEFLRPPTRSALHERLKDHTRPIHVLHFDGHGTFDEKEAKQGVLAFENEKGQGDQVKGEDMAKELQNSSVRLVVLNACKSAVSASDNALTSVATQLIHGGVGAVIAMSASVLVDTAARYVEAFYRALATGTSTSIAQERARWTLYKNPRRHPLRRHRDKEGIPVELYDWWLPHFYQQRPLTLQSTKKEVVKEKQQTLHLPRLNKDMPAEPRYGFHGRAYELLRIERSLLQGKLVIIHGFGGIGKTVLTREAADWLTQTKMYDRACFISFEGGGDATTFLSALGRYLGLSDSNYNPKDTSAALRQLEAIFKKQHILIIADSLESILPGGKAELESTVRARLWDTLLELIRENVGVLLTTRDAILNDKRLQPGSKVTRLPLAGLHPEDAYALASHLLDKCRIDRSHLPYAELRDLLAQLDHHPLMIQLVLPILSALPFSQIKADLPALLPRLVDDTEIGRNRSLLVSLDYSLQQLNAEHRALLPRLMLFERGAFEYNVLAITDIPQIEWEKLRLALEQAALLRVEKIPELLGTVPFLHFHPVLTPYLRSQYAAEGLPLRRYFALRYCDMILTLHEQYGHNPQPVKALVQWEFPNLRRAVELWIELGEPKIASGITNVLAWFLTFFGWDRERNEVRRIAEAIASAEAKGSDALTLAEFIRESGLGADEFAKGNMRAACNRFTALLERIEVLPKGTSFGPGSFDHCLTLGWQARCLASSGQPAAAEDQMRESLRMIDVLISQEPEEQELIRQKGRMLTTLGDILRDQGRYQQAQKVYEEGLKISREQEDLRAQSVTLGQLGAVMMTQGDAIEARAFFNASLAIKAELEEPESEANTWHQLGWIAQNQKEWKEAERCYRKSLEIWERYGNEARAAWTCNNLAILVEHDDHPMEAEVWYKRALELDERACPDSPEHALHLSNLAALLMSEVRAKHIPVMRLTEARSYAERALAIKKTLDGSSQIWMTLHILADIAELEGREIVAQDYRHLARMTSAAFAGKGYAIDAAIHDELQYSDQEAFSQLVRTLSDEEIFEQAVEAISKAAKRLLQQRSLASTQQLLRLNTLIYNIVSRNFRKSLPLDQLVQIGQVLEEEGIGPLLSHSTAPVDIYKRVFNYRGYCLAERGEYTASIEHFNATLSIDPYFAPAYCNRARAYIELNCLEEAWTDCQMLRSFDPNYPMGQATCQLIEALRR